MADVFPFHYQHPYVMCSQCGGNGYNRHQLQPGCDYVERASFNRFEPSPPVLPTTSCIRPPPNTCNTVSSLTYTEGEYVAPQIIQTINQCNPQQKGSEFHVSRVRYQTM
jgi:hypothetical protein